MKPTLANQAVRAIAALCMLPFAVDAVGAAGIATVVDVVNEGYRTPPGADETSAKASDELMQNEALRTEEESMIQVKFVDGSELNVEQSSEMVLSDYVFDGSATAGLIKLNSGLFYFKSSGIKDHGVELRTPVATIGIRGTEFLVHVDQDQATIVDILTGTVEARPLGKGKSVTCFEGQSILIAGVDDDGQCGDIGSFSTAAAPPSSKSADSGQRGGSDRERSTPEHKAAERPSNGAGPDPDPDPDPSGPPGTGGCGLSC